MNSLPTEPETPNPQTYLLRPLLSQILEKLQDPNYNPDTDDYKIMSSILFNLDLFKNNFQSPTEFQEFVNLVKSLFTYEVHPYGSIFIKEKEFAEKFYIILKGEVQRFHQRPFSDVEREIQEDQAKIQPEVQNVPTIETQKSIVSPLKLKSLMTPWQTLRNSLGMKGGGLSRTNTNSRKGLSLMSIEAQSPKLKLNLKPIVLENPMLSARAGGITRENTKNIAQTVRNLGQMDSTEGNQVDKSGGMSSKREDSESIEEGLQKDNVNEIEKPVEPPVVRMKEETVEFLRFLVEKSPDIKERCFFNEKARMDCERVYQCGDYFGENFCKQFQYKEKYMLAASSEEVHVLVLTKENYKLVIDELARQPGNKTQFFKRVFPVFDEESIIQFAQLFSIRQYQKGETIYQQGELTKDLYLVQDGEVKLFKESEVVQKEATATPRNNIVKNIAVPIASIPKYHFFGEERLLKDNNRKFSAIANAANTAVYSMDARNFRIFKTSFGDFFEVLEEQAEKRFQWRQERVMELSEQFGLKPIKSNKNKSVSTNEFNLDLQNNVLTKEEIKPIGRTSSLLSLRQTQSVFEIKNLFQSPKVKKKETPIAQNTMKIYKTKYSRKAESVPTLEEKGGQKKKKDEVPENFLETLKQNILSLKVREMERSPKSKREALFRSSPEVTSPMKTSSLFVQTKRGSIQLQPIQQLEGSHSLNQSKPSNGISNGQTPKNILAKSPLNFKQNSTLSSLQFDELTQNTWSETPRLKRFFQALNYQPDNSPVAKNKEEIIPEKKAVNIHMSQMRARRMKSVSFKNI